MSNKEQLQENNETLESVLYALTNNPTATELQMNLDEHKEDTKNPHGVTKSQVGLGNVPNVSTNDQTPTYSEASAITALSSGEKLATAFGKIAKAISSLISHIANTSNPHSVTATQVGAAPTSHEHSASDVTSGTLAVARGGTGSTNGATGLNNLLKAGNTVLSSYQYGDELPSAGTKGRFFLKKVT